ncbi:hypothetical protein V866_001926 [Kwoniella sp. B9012]
MSSGSSPTNIKPKKKLIIKDNRPGLFDDMVFYLHEYKGNYKGQGNNMFMVKQEISTNGGRTTHSPTDPNLTHILVPPDRESRSRDEDQSSILNLREIQNQTYNHAKTKEEVAVWDIPNLVLFFGQHLNEDGEIIKEPEVPVLRMGWVLRCVWRGRVLCEEDGDWDGQYLRARIFPDFQYRPRVDIRPIQAIQMGGEGVTNAHLDFARQMSSGGTISYTARATHRSSTASTLSSSYQPRKSLSDRDIRDQAFPPKDWTRNAPTRPTKPNRWSALTGALTRHRQQDDTQQTESPLLPKANETAGTTINHADSDLLKQSSSRQAVDDERCSPVANLSNKSSIQSPGPQHPSEPEALRGESKMKETYISKTPISSVHSASHHEPNKKRGSPTDRPALALAKDPRPKRRKVQVHQVTEEERPPTPPLPEELQTIPMTFEKAKSQLPSPPETLMEAQINDPDRSAQGDDKNAGTLKSTSSRSDAKFKSVTPSISSRTTQVSPCVQSDLSKIFSNGRPMTFYVHQGDFATEFFIKSGGGVIHPIEYASTTIFQRSAANRSHQERCTAEEEDILDGVELRGDWQVVMSSRWVEHFLRQGLRIPDDDYRITKVPRNMSLSVCVPPDDLLAKGHRRMMTEMVVGMSDKGDDDAGDESESESVIWLDENKPAFAVRSKAEPVRNEDRQTVIKPDLLAGNHKPSAVARTSDPSNPINKSGKSKISSHNYGLKIPSVESDMISGRTQSHKGIGKIEERKKRSSVSTKGENKVTGSKSSVQGIDQLVNILVEEMRYWNPKKCRRTKFLTELTTKRPERQWRKFFDRHRSKISSRFDQLGYVYPDTDTIKVKIQKEKQEEEEEDDDDLEELMSDYEEDSIYEPSVN